jgi:hypothetical protein
VIKLFGPCFYLLGFGSFINFRYIAFDFHRICGHIHFERLSSLYNDIREDLDKQGYYLVNAEGKILEKQKGVVRTNCIDCLDRTNVTQSLLGRKALEMQLQRIGVFEASECIQPQDQLDEKFKLCEFCTDLVGALQIFMHAHSL